MANEDIRTQAREAGIPLWKIGSAVGRSEITMIRWMREELSPDRRRLVLGAIQKLKDGEDRCKSGY